MRKEEEKKADGPNNWEPAGEAPVLTGKVRKDEQTRPAY